MTQTDTRDLTQTAAIRTIEPSDIETIVELNQDALEGVGPLDHESAASLVDKAEQALVVDVDGDIAGFVITLPMGADYDSSRYRWFEDRLDEYTYLDRIVVSGDFRRQGIASHLYDAIEGDKPVALEIYDTNDVSLAFHHGRGYEQIGEVVHAGKRNLMCLKAS